MRVNESAAASTKVVGAAAKYQGYFTGWLQSRRIPAPETTATCAWEGACGHETTSAPAPKPPSRAVSPQMRQLEHDQ